MFLTQILLDLNSPRVLGKHRTAYQTHKSILTAFPEPLPAEERILFRRERVEEQLALRLLVQSHTAPDWAAFISDHRPSLLTEPETKQHQPHFAAGDVLAFRLTANPTVKRNGSRHALYREADQIDWLHRKLQAGGAQPDLPSPRVTNLGLLKDKSAHGQVLNVAQARFDGVLQVTNAHTFYALLAEGVGPAKGLGCGLLSVALLR